MHNRCSRHALQRCDPRADATRTERQGTPASKNGPGDRSHTGKNKYRPRRLHRRLHHHRPGRPCPWPPASAARSRRRPRSPSPADLVQSEAKIKETSGAGSDQTTSMGWLRFGASTSHSAKAHDSRDTRTRSTAKTSTPQHQEGNKRTKSAVEVLRRPNPLHELLGQQRGRAKHRRLVRRLVLLTGTSTNVTSAAAYPGTGSSFDMG